ncbi:hypothetical protein RFI_31106 [Reticulomyxa filosa]|uniref:Uncharacterized protein n=1 Tax=Reticulomyxa filosa TaxID=46433 RepID=X6LY57_RETFI|nr:hypothetical protein RFI_31106 [Reticulomyxa filosa]|eukprot:ETO06291.1 hypothetical protein RFI_31106 [Reticulomyxa filosa]
MAEIQKNAKDNHKRVSSSGLEGLKILTDIISQHLRRMKEQDSLVEAAIDNVSDKENQTMLRKAKQKALEEEKQLLSSLQLLELGDFLRNSRMYDELYVPHKSEQKKARTTYAPEMEEYESKPVPLTEGSNIVSLLFGAQHLYLPAFEKFISQVLSQFKKQEIKLVNHSKVSCKNIERTFLQGLFFFFMYYKRYK